MNQKTTKKSPTDVIDTLFHHLGLSDKQVALYKVLLENKPARANRISQLSGVNRSNTYVLLKDLLNRGLIEEYRKSGVSYFRARNPYTLLDQAKKQEQQSIIARKMVENSIGELTTQWKKTNNKPVVRFFQGEEGVMEVMDDVYAEGKDEILGCVGWHRPTREVLNTILKKYRPLRIKRGIFTRALNSRNEAGEVLYQKQSEKLSEIFLAHKEKYPLPAEIDVYDNKVAMMSFVKDDFVGIVIENAEFATTLSSVFRLLFDLLRKKEHHHDRSTSSSHR